MPRSPVTLVINAFNALTEDEKKLCLDFIAPEPEPQQPAKQTRKKRTTKSAKAQSLESVITKTPKTERSADPCVYQFPEDSPVNAGMVCDEFFENGIHDKTMGYVGYHPFVAPAQTATRRSSRKGATPNSTPNSETNLEGALAVGAGGD